MPTHNNEKTSTTDDLAARSDDDLFDILTHIDRRLAAERYVAARDEFARRHGPRIKGQSLDDYFDRARQSRPFAARSTFKKKMLIGLAVWSLALLLLRAVMYLRGLR
jgi:hypothetical protein